MSALFRKITVPFVLAAFVFAAFFGFSAMSSGPDGRMQGDCPFSATGVPQCPQNAVAAVVHHLSAYQSFLNVPVNLGTNALLIAFFIIGVALILLAAPPLAPLAPIAILYESPPSSSCNKKLIRWLSLLENSPSLR